MSAEKSTVNLSQLFNELHRNEQNGDYEKAVKVTNKILNEDSSNAKALHCKIVCLIQIGSFKDALREIEKCDKSLSNSLLFEKAYCEYRLNKANDALETLNSIKEPNYREKELRAQTLYRLELFNECLDVYLDLIKNSEDEYEDERETNLAAVVASLTLSDDSYKNAPELGEQTFELSYNKACILIGQKQYKDALEKLNVAEEKCKKTLEDEGMTEEEVESELGIVRAQIGYCYQSLKKQETALRMYNQVLKQKPNDSALIAVTSNNIVTINKDQNVFDSKKKMKTALTDLSDSKLSKVQKRTIFFNNCLLLMHTNQGDTCRKQLTVFKSNFPEATSEATLLEASLLCKEKKLNDALKLLKSVAETKPDLTLEISLANAQLLLSQGDYNNACQILRSLGDVSFKPGIISSVVSLYLSQENKTEAANVLSKAVQWHETKNKENSPELLFLYRENARLLIETGNAKAAANLLERIRKANPKNVKIISMLIGAYSQFDSNKAQEISKNLPSIENIVSSVDIETLETSNWSLGVKYVKKTTKADSSPGVNMVLKNDKKKKKRKKKKLPKSYDPTVDPDPERWLPRHQRSTYKKKKDKRVKDSVGKGTQGAVSEVDFKPAKATQNATASPQQGPRQQRPTQKKKKKSAKR